MKMSKIGLLVAIMITLAQADAGAAHICRRIEPVVIDGVRFSSPNDQGFHGYIRAVDAKTGTNLWEQTIYRVIWRFPFPELDMYYCVITVLKAKDGKLLIQNDRKKWYSLDPKTQKVKRITAEDVTEKQKETKGQPQGRGYSPPAARSAHPTP